MDAAGEALMFMAADPTVVPLWGAAIIGGDDVDLVGIRSDLVMIVGFVSGESSPGWVAAGASWSALPVPCDPMAAVLDYGHFPGGCPCGLVDVGWKMLGLGLASSWVIGLVFCPLGFSCNLFLCMFLLV